MNDPIGMSILENVDKFKKPNSLVDNINQMELDQEREKEKSNQLGVNYILNAKDEDKRREKK